MQSDPGNHELVEKMARAIYEAWCEVHKVSDTSMPWEEIDAEEREACFFEARAALSVARLAIKEECARVAEGPVYRTGGSGEVAIRGTDAANWTVPQPVSGFKGNDYGTGRADAAAAIRAME